MFEEIDELAKLNKKHREKMEKEGREAIKTVLTKFLIEHNVRLYWTQYVPGFNDGEPCTFTMGSMLVGFENPKPYVQTSYIDQEEDDVQFQDSDGIKYLDSYCLKDNKFKEDFKKLERAFQDMEDVLESAFGCNVEINVTKDKIIIEDYSCGY